MLRVNHLRRRRAAAAVETAAVVAVFLLLLFGIVEYCRFVYYRQLVNNAAREGARYAVVHTYDASVEADTRTQVLSRMGGVDGKVRNFTVQLYQGDANGNRASAYNPSGSAQYPYFADASGNYLLDSQNNKIYTATDKTGTYVLDGSKSKVYLNLDTRTQTVTGVNPAAFNNFVSTSKIQGVDPITNARFGEYVVVDVICDYDPITPAFLRLNQTITIRTKSLMYSEAN